MIVKEILLEFGSVFDPRITTDLKKKGYKFLKKGADQQAWLEPGTGLILKIFGTTLNNQGYGRLSKAQQSFKDFADYCQKHKDNPFLPNFLGWETFYRGGETYLQIRMERLFPFPNKYWGEWLEEMANAAWNYPNPMTWYAAEMSGQDEGDYVPGTAFSEALPELLSHLGEDGFKLLWKTIRDLEKIADRKGYGLDLHSKNFMLGSDGHIVISDPFFAR